MKNVLIKIDTKSVHYLNNIEGEFKESKTYGFKKIIDFNDEFYVEMTEPGDDENENERRYSLNSLTISSSSSGLT